MAQKKTHTAPKNITKNTPTPKLIPKELPPIAESKLWSFTNFKMQAIILIIIGFVIYSNSFYNEYALDDGIVIQKNDYVQKGISGIPEILSTDAYDSFYRQMGAKQELAGGRYRPLSVVTFAIEESLFGSTEKVKPPTDVAFVRHVLNVVFYILSIVVLLYFLKNFIFKETPLVAFITTLIFLIHPIHTEVISNVKSRDEILSFLFVILTFIAVLRYSETKEKKHLIWGLFLYLLALLSKEYGITLLILIPMLLYIVSGETLQKSIVSTIPYFIVALIYLFIRFKIVGVGKTGENPDVLNAPFKFATGNERLATKFDILNRYLKLMFYPDPLSSDYSYSTIPFSNFKNGRVWLSLVIHVSLIVSTIVLFFKRNILSFALAFYLLHLALISNFLMEIGATMGERLVYNSSLGFAMIVALGINFGLKKISNPKVRTAITVTLGLIVTVWCADKVIKRNAQWKNDSVLFIADAETVPNSVLVNGNAGKAYMDLSELPENKGKEKEFIAKAIFHLTRAVSVHKRYVNGYLNLGVAYYKLGNLDKAKEQWDIAKVIYPNNPFLITNFKALGSMYYNKAVILGSKKPLNVPDLLEAIKLLEKATEVDPNNANYWYDLGGVSYMIQDFNKARNAWQKALEIDPKNQRAIQGMAALPKQ
jgi:hypothetical protein